MKYTIDIKILLDREIIRDDNVEEYLNKMTDEEIIQFEKEIEQSLIEENVPKEEWNAAFLAKYIDRGILYNVLKLS